MKSTMIQKVKEIKHKTYLFLFIVTLVGCTEKPAKQGEMKQLSSNTLIEKTALEEENNVALVSIEKNVQQSTDMPLQKETAKQDEIISKEIDLNKIYEDSEVVRAFPSLNNSQLLDFISKHFKYPNIESVNGKGSVDLVIERDGTVSDVIIIKGIHPAVDKEFIRVLKLLPKFTPGRINETPVRSKFRAPINASTM